jgi:hypothetical protein
MEGFYCGVETDHVVPGGMKALRRQIFVVGYLLFVEIKHAALCSTAYRAANSSKEPEKTAVCGSYRNTAKE